MALDLGEKRIGVALSDPSQMLARSYAVVKRSSRARDFSEFARIVAQENVQSLLVGLPTQLNGEDGALAKWVRDYAGSLSTHLDLPYTLFDESFTTQRASASMRERGKRAREQRGWLDAVAAAILLQDFLDMSA